MIVKSIKIVNYKSLADESNILYIEDDITTIIGKNESGKTNILSAISSLSFRNVIPPAVYTLQNKSSTSPVCFEITLVFTSSELEKYGITQKETLFIFEQQKVTFNGGLSDLISNSTFFQESAAWFSEEAKITLMNNTKHANNTNNANANLNKLLSLHKTYFTDYISTRESLIRTFNIEGKQKQEAISWIRNSIDEISELFSMLPNFFIYNTTAQLKATYSINEINQIYETHKTGDVDILQKFLKVCEISHDEIKTLFSTADVGKRKMLRNIAEKKINQNVFAKFKDFYTQEIFEISVVLEINSFSILFTAGETYTSLSERSNGLRWYFTFFIESLFQNISSNYPVVYLFDEPGVYLHVNAQKELICLFQDLADKGNQIIYTTHSPYMINNDKLKIVRAIQKDENGNSGIYNVYDTRLSSGSKMETLSPLTEALGVDLKYNIGPSSYKHNIITEGITDYYYVCAMLRYLNVDEEHIPSIIPSSGAENIPHIISILIGWGVSFGVLLDYDATGRRVFKAILEKFGETIADKVEFVNCKKFSLPFDKEQSETIESLINPEDYKSICLDETDKTIKAKLFYDKVTAKEITLSKITEEKFTELFKKLDILH